MRRPTKYVLNSRKEPVPIDDLQLWAAVFEDNQIVKQESITELAGLWTPFEHPWVSTVFLGLDYNFSNEGPPIVFETMIFNGIYDHKEQWRYSTWDEAMKGHERAVKMVKDPLYVIAQIKRNFWYWWEYNWMEVHWKKLTRRLSVLKKIYTTTVTKLRRRRK